MENRGDKVLIEFRRSKKLKSTHKMEYQRTKRQKYAFAPPKINFQPPLQRGTGKFPSLEFLRIV